MSLHFRQVLSVLMHLCPVLVYISKAPSTAATYDGSGQWAKIYQIAPQISSSGINWNDVTDTFNFKLPSSLAAGEYLLRIEHIALHVISPPHTLKLCLYRG